MAVKYLTESGWKAILQQNKGKVKDNGLQRALNAYEKLPAEKYAERYKTIGLVWKLAILLLDSKSKITIPAVRAYLEELTEAAGKESEAVEKAKKAATVSEVEKDVMRNSVRDAANLVSTNAKTNALIFGQEIISACKAFEVYAKPRLEDLEDEISAEDLLGPLVAVITGGIGGMVVGGVTDAVGKIVVAEINKVALDKFNKRLTGAGSSSKEAALKKAVDSLVLGAVDTATAIRGIVAKEVMPKCDKVVTEVNAHRMVDGALGDFITPFYLQTPSKTDELIDKRFGIPTPARSKAAQTQIYGQLVARFEEKVILAGISGAEGIKMNITGDTSGPRRKAQGRAKAAVREREGQMGSKADEMGM